MIAILYGGAPVHLVGGAPVHLVGGAPVHLVGGAPVQFQFDFLKPCHQLKVSSATGYYHLVLVGNQEQC